MMKQSTAIIITVVAALLCGLPSLLMICIGAFALIGLQMPDAMATNPGTPEQAVLGAWIFIGCGGALLLIPIAAGIFSFRLSSMEESISDLNEPLE